MGQAKPIWHREGVFSFPKFEQRYATPQTSAPIAVIEPVQLDVGVSGAGTALLQGSIQPHVQAQSFGCQITLTPEVRGDVSGGARLEPMPGIQQVLELLVGDASAGLDGRLTLIDLKLPLQLGMGVRTGGPNGPLLGIDQNVSATFQADILMGQLIAWFELDLGGVAGFFADVFGVDRTIRKEFTLHEWPGDHAQIELETLKNSINFTQ
jgi:hypothetical protein